MQCRVTSDLLYDILVKVFFINSYGSDTSKYKITCMLFTFKLMFAVLVMLFRRANQFPFITNLYVDKILYCAD